MPDLIDYDGYFFDLDGTVFLGDRLLPGVEETIAMLRERWKTVQFLSNTTIRSRLQCQSRLRDLGLEVRIDEIVTAAYVSAVYLQEISPKPVVLVIGDPALAAELHDLGVCTTNQADDATHVLAGN